MKALFLLLGAVFLFTGCSTHSDEQIAAIRSAGVSPYTVAKLQRDDVIHPEDIIELRRRRVPDSVPIRHLREVGVDYVPQRDDLRRMRSADVHGVVIDEVIIAGQRFVSDRYDRPNYNWALSIPLFLGLGYAGHYYGHHYNHSGHHHSGHHHSGHHGHHH